jgi:hypothetical protein
MPRGERHELKTPQGAGIGMNNGALVSIIAAIVRVLIALLLALILGIILGVPAAVRGP